jgi:glycine cleavage system aminomethyltransferase T
VTGPPRARQPLHYTVRRSPYFERTVALGAVEFMVYNHTYMPLDYGRDPRVDYDALVERVTLWDVGAERQAELRGPDALAFADYLSPRRLDDLPVGGCRFTPVCDEAGEIMADCIVLRPWGNVVWFSHGDVDLELWAHGLARATGFDVRVSEADVAPLQLQGPRAADVLYPLTDADVRDLPRFRCLETTVAGVPAVVSATGWSREPGFEVYPLGSDRAVEIWDAIVAAGDPHGLLVTGPNVVRAVEQGITDTQYRVNSGLNPIEAGLDAMLDLDRSAFVGREALRRVREHGAARCTIGLVADGEPMPWLEDFWPLTLVDGRPAGVVRWAVWSYALERNIAIALVDRAVADAARFVIKTPTGPVTAAPHAIPFVDASPPIQSAR